MTPARTIFVLVSAAIVFGALYLFSTTQPGRDAGVILAACTENKNWEACYSGEFEKLATRVGPTQSFKTLTLLQERDPGANGCHFIAHGIGYGTYEGNPGAWRESFRSISGECTYGAMHGLIERGVAELPNGLGSDVLPTVCGMSPRADCNHIVGHLVLIETRRNIEKAIGLCEALGAERQVSFCLSGVFMEEETAVNLIRHGYADESALDWRARAPELTKLCARQTGAAARECWTEFAHIAVAASDGDAAGAFRWCGYGGAYTTDCSLHAIGILGATEQFDFARAPAICGLSTLSPQFKNTCYASLAGSALSSKPALAREAVRYCGNLSDEFKRSCFGVVEGSLRDVMKPRTMRSLCADVPIPYRNFCEKGSGEELHTRAPQT